MKGPYTHIPTPYRTPWEAMAALKAWRFRQSGDVQDHDGCTVTPYTNGFDDIWLVRGGDDTFKLYLLKQKDGSDFPTRMFYPEESGRKANPEPSL